MLNISQVQSQVKQVDLSGVTASTRHPQGYNLAYRQLKQLGWQCGDGGADLEKHPVDKVPVFRLNGASIRRNKRDGGWIVEIGGEEFDATGDVAQITAHVKALIDQVQTEAQVDTGHLSTIAFDRGRQVYVVRNGSLIGEFPAGDEGRAEAERAALRHDGPAEYRLYRDLVEAGADEGRARRAARLVQRGLVNVEAGTVVSQETGEVYSVNGACDHPACCDCPDYRYRAEQVGEDFRCKHQLAMEIARALAGEDGRERIWQAIVRQIDSGQLPLLPGGQQEIGQLNGKAVIIYRRRDDRICLYDGLSRTSAPIAVFGRDWDRQSSAYAGKWKLAESARAAFDAWLNPAPRAHRWRKTAGGWMAK